MRLSTLFVLTICAGIAGSFPVAAATTYTYDSLGRLSTVTYDNGKEIVYTYDAAGNRTQVTISP